MREIAHMSDIKEGIADVLREMMRRSGKTPSQLADMIAKPASTVNRYIRADGARKPTKTTMSTVTLIALSRATGVAITFDGDTVYPVKKDDREFAKDALEVGILHAWRAIEPADKAAVLQWLRRALPPGEADHIFPAA